MSGGYISFYNASTAFSDAELQNALPDFQNQVSYEFNWYWGINAYLDVNGWGTPIIITDYPGPNDPQDALGYHYIDGNFQPYGVIFAGLCQDYGYPVTGVLSHELLELLADQQTDTVNLYDFGDGTGIIVIQEVCDPCEMSLYYEAPNGNVVSDFALPGWWVPGYPYQVDFLGAIQGPLQLASGGYISYQYVTLSGWQQVFGDRAKQDLDRAAAELRQQIAAGGNPRVDTIRRMQIQAGQAGQAAQAEQAGQPARAGALRHPPTGAPAMAGRPGRGRMGPQPAAAGQPGGGETILARRQQPARRQTGQFTVVRRDEVPEVGQLTSVGQLWTPEEAQPQQQQQQPQQEERPAPATGRGGASRGRGGPRAQTVSAKS